ncbi:MAG: acetolactate synthase small subunit [Candidatus Hydrothermarchaeaceae archaeon]
MNEAEHLHILVVLVEDHPGVLQRVAGMFRKRNFNIDSITVGHSEQEGISRMTITVRGDTQVLEQVMKQLNKLIEVIKVLELPRDDTVSRELALLKIKTKDEKARAEVVQYANIFRGRVIDVRKDSLIVEITGDRDKVDAFVKLASMFGIQELAKTGVTAMARGRLE